MVLYHCPAIQFYRFLDFTPAVKALKMSHDEKMKLTRNELRDIALKYCDEILTPAFTFNFVEIGVGVGIDHACSDCVKRMLTKSG